MIIGIHGKARAGKDTFADMLIGSSKCKTDNDFTKLAFADPVYEATSAMFGLDARSVEDKEAVIPEWGMSLRQMLQTVGTEIGRNMIAQDIWLKNMSMRMSRVASPHIIISDVRFENEAHFIRERGGIMIFVERPNTQQVRQHVSEAGVAKDDKSITIHNESTLDSLQQIADKFVIDLSKYPLEKHLI